MIDFLKEEKVDSHLIARVEEFRKNHSVPKEEKSRIPDPKFRYYGRDIWEQAISALLCGKNLLLAGPKATGKNVLSENLAAVFGRPSYDISFHVNTDASTLIGADTLKDGNVIFREISLRSCCQNKRKDAGRKCPASFFQFSPKMEGSSQLSFTIRFSNSSGGRGFEK
jgi:nitric oxide reductase NorQ protein